MSVKVKDLRYIIQIARVGMPAELLIKEHAVRTWKSIYLTYIEERLQ